MPSFLCSVLQRVVKSSVTLQLPEHQHKVLHLSRHLAVGFSRGQGAAGTGTAPSVPQGDAGRGCSCSGHRAGQCRGCWCFGCIHCTILSTLLQVLGSRASFLQAQTPSTKHKAPPHRHQPCFHTPAPRAGWGWEGAGRVSRHPNLALCN